jgi:hypothetical protein
MHASLILWGARYARVSTSRFICVPRHISENHPVFGMFLPSATLAGTFSASPSQRNRRCGTHGRDGFQLVPALQPAVGIER